MIILLDLNYTLVANSKFLRGKGHLYRVKHEQYRQWLIDLITRMQPERTIILTVRHQSGEDWTMKSIRDKTGWQPDEAIFNWTEKLGPPAFKKLALIRKIMPRFGKDPKRYLPIESNTDTHKMYASFGIHGIKVFPAVDCKFTEERNERERRTPRLF